MNFAVCGGFPIERGQSRIGVFDEGFWERVRQKDEELPGACGCYVFALQNGTNIVTWYVGKTERRTFDGECFHPTKIVYYHEVLAKRRGRPLLFLLPRLTNSGSRYSRPTTHGYRDIDFLETLLIGMALERNEDLMNVKKTKLLREIVVPGVINSQRARPSAAVRDLQNALGLTRA